MAPNAFRNTVGRVARSVQTRRTERATPHYETVPAASSFPLEPALPDLGVAISDLVKMMHYDLYLAYSYGRHVRGYTRHELIGLLEFMGFAVESHFTTDAHPELAAGARHNREMVPLLKRRAPDLGQYLFTRSRMTDTAPDLDALPTDRFRNYPAARMVESGR